MSNTCSHTTIWLRIGAATKGHDDSIGVEFRWEPFQSSIFASEGGTPLQVFDVQLSAKLEKGSNAGLIDNLEAHQALVETGQQSEAQVMDSDAFGSPVAFEFLKDCAQSMRGNQIPRLVRFMNPLHKGTIIKSDILSFRLRDAFWVEKVASFASPLQHFPGRPLLDDHDHTVSVLDIIRASASAAMLKANITIAEIETDFAQKVSLPIISSQPLTRKRLVLVGTSNQGPSGGGWFQFARHAALTLGIDLVIIDRKDGWLARGNFSSWYEALLHPALSSAWWDDLSPEEIVRLVTEYRAGDDRNGGEERRIDGLATIIEALQVPVAIAAERLNLPHEPISAFETATNKYKLGLFQHQPGFLVSSADEVMNLLDEDSQHPQQQNGLTFPLIVKPCFGFNSEGVSLVDSSRELDTAVQKARGAGRSRAGGVGDGVLVQPYCKGPEVDVNMVFIDGEVVFDEICDDFPKRAEVDHRINGKDHDTGDDNFQETYMVYPSALPANEQAALRRTVSAMIKGLGLRNGVMHVEARVANSSYEYQYFHPSGILDLAPRNDKDKTTTTEKKADTAPEAWILEVNPRPPGVFAAQTPASVYGVDYWAVSLLLAVGDKERARVLARPFGGAIGTTTMASTSTTFIYPSPAHHHHQLHAVLVMIRADLVAFPPSTSSKGYGIFASDDVCEELLARHPDLREHIGLRGCLIQRGQRIPHPKGGQNTFLAYFNVFSRTSRSEALELAKRVREEVRYEIC